MKKIYIILTQSGTLFSKILKIVTKDTYNHSSICLKDDFREFYSFGRKNPYLMLPAGFVIENAFQGVYHRFTKIPCCILEMEITDEQYIKLEEIIQYFANHMNQYSYAVTSLVLADTPYCVTSNNKFFCSQFVAKILNDIDVKTPKSPEHMHPINFAEMENTVKIFEGDLKEFILHQATI